MMQNDSELSIIFTIQVGIDTQDFFSSTNGPMGFFPAIGTITFTAMLGKSTEH